MRRSSDSRCDYVVVSDSLEGLTPAVTVRELKPEPRDPTDIPPSNLSDPIDLDSSPKHLVRRKIGKRKQAETEAEGQPPRKVQRKKITRKGNLDFFISESVGKCCFFMLPLCALKISKTFVAFQEVPISFIPTEP
ncbi:hypothetical protein Hdeb2414_s0070g00772311 [Helianthus debilis subsp. tardiflorus]